MIDCLDLTSRFDSFEIEISLRKKKWNFFSTNFCSTELPEYATRIAANEPLIVDEIVPELIGALARIQLRLQEPVKKKFYHFKTLKTHLLPLTNVAFDKFGSRYVPHSPRIYS